MKLFLYAILFLTFSGCCFMNKCHDSDTRVSFHILDFTTGKDLVFGPARVYKSDSLRFFSINMYGDTVNHAYAPRSLSGNDSILDVNIDVMDRVPVFVRLNAVDTDTIRLIYMLDDGGKCCDASKSIHSVTYNNDTIYHSDGRVYKKGN